MLIGFAQADFHAIDRLGTQQHRHRHRVQSAFGSADLDRPLKQGPSHLGWFVATAVIGVFIGSLPELGLA